VLRSAERVASGHDDSLARESPVALAAARLVLRLDLVVGAFCCALSVAA